MYVSGNVTVMVRDFEGAVRFYTDVLGFKVSDQYPGSMVPGGMVFLRCNGDHHCLALVGGKGQEPNGKSLHHIAFELATLDEAVLDLLVGEEGFARVANPFLLGVQEPTNS